MNGGIEVDSAPGKGSTFVARIWLENDEAQAPVSLEERFRHLKALVVDADEGLGTKMSLHDCGRLCLLTILFVQRSRIRNLKF